MCKKANDLVPKEQIRRQMTWYVSKKGLLKVSLGCWMYAFMTNSILIIFCSLEVILTDRLRRKSTSKTKKAQIKAWHKILGPEIFSYEEFLCKARQKKNYTLQHGHSLESVASNLSYNSYLSVWIICVHSFLKLCRKYRYYL